MTQLLETAAIEPAAPRKRTAGLVGNGLVLAGVVLGLAEFAGIIATGVHPMPDLPGASTTALLKTYSGQSGAIGFLVGWFSLTASGRVLAMVGMRRALRDSGYRSSLPDLAVALMAVTVAMEVLEYALCAGAASAADRGDTRSLVLLNQVAHYTLVGFYGPGGLAGVVIAWGMWRSGVFPRVLTGLLGAASGVLFLDGVLLSAPRQAQLQDNLTVINLLAFVLDLWLGIVVFHKRPKGAGLPSEA